jgi:hypothetical protein
MDIGLAAMIKNSYAFLFSVGSPTLKSTLSGRWGTNRGIFIPRSFLSRGGPPTGLEELNPCPNESGGPEINLGDSKSWDKTPIPCPHDNEGIEGENEEAENNDCERILKIRHSKPSFC